MMERGFFIHLKARISVGSLLDIFVDKVGWPFWVGMAFVDRNERISQDMLGLKGYL